ncbi:MAG: zinc metallopeptidase [Caldilineaceae bacterium]
MFYFDPIFFLFALPPLILGMWAQARVRGAFNKYSGVRTATGVTGAQAARKLLDDAGLRSVAVERVNGFLSDHYDPRGKVLRLSSDVYDGPTIAAVGVAAHETGHAPSGSRFPARRCGCAVRWCRPCSSAVGWARSSSWSASSCPAPSGNSIAWIGLLIFGLTALFAVVTLPVEFSTTKRAKQLLVSKGILAPRDAGRQPGAGTAALTYVAAALQAIMQVLYCASILLRRRGLGATSFVQCGLKRAWLVWQLQEVERTMDNFQNASGFVRFGRVGTGGLRLVAPCAGPCADSLCPGHTDVAGVACLLGGNDAAVCGHLFDAVGLVLLSCEPAP